MKVRIERFEDLRDNEKLSFVQRDGGTKHMGYQLKERIGDYILVYYNTDINNPPYRVADVYPEVLNNYYIEVERDDKIKYRNSKE